MFLSFYQYNIVDLNVGWTHVSWCQISPTLSVAARKIRDIIELDLEVKPWNNKYKKGDLLLMHVMMYNNDIDNIRCTTIYDIHVVNISILFSIYF